MKKFFLPILLAGSLYANPEGMKVVSGSAVLTNSQKELTIETGERAILSWDKFSIGKDELTRFNMPSSSSAVLNRVTSREMSQILGKLESNGRVYLLNPNGVIIGKDAYINAASFIASTYDVLDSEFLKNGDLSFSGNSNEKIVNLGTIRAFDGDAILIGRYVQNDGSIEAEKGVAALGAGKEILLKPLDKERIYIRPNIESQKEETGIENNGEIKAVSSYLKADGNLYSLAIKNSGKIDALAFEEKGGEIFLIAENSTVETSGELKAVKESKGGEVRLLGKNVGLLEKAIIDVSHENDGGTVLIGGDYQGKNKDVYNAKAVFVGKDTSIDASSLKEGNAGKVILWSDDCTKFYGKILAEGGKNKGDGGFVEVSGAFLEYQGLASTNAINGKVGQLLLDPNFLTITNTSPSNPAFPLGATVYNPPGPSANLFITDLVNNLNLNNVTITNSGSSLDTISVTGVVQWGTSNSLTLQWPGDIFVNNAATDAGFVCIGGGAINITTGRLLIGQTSPYPSPSTPTSSFVRTTGNINLNASSGLFMVGGSVVDAMALLVAGGSLTGTIAGINMLDNVGGVEILANDLNVNLNSNNITMTVPLGGNLTLITTQGGLTLSNVNNIFLDAFDGAVNIHSQAGGNVKINDLNARGSGGIFLNNSPGAHGSGETLIGTDNSGTVECYFSGDSIINTLTSIFSQQIVSNNFASPSQGKITFYGNSLTILDGHDNPVAGISGFSIPQSGDLEIHLNNLTITETRALGLCGIFLSHDGGSGSVSGSIKTIQLTGGGGNAFIQVNNGSITLDNLNGTTTLTSPGAGQAFMRSSGNLTITNLASLEMVPTGNDTFITSTVGNIVLNSLAAKGNFINLNNAGSPHSAYLATTTSGNIECYFAGPTASVIKGGSSGSCGIFTGFNAGGIGGNIIFSSGDLNIDGQGGDAGIFSGYLAGAFSGTGNITFNTSALNISSQAVLTGKVGIVAGTTAPANITNSSSTSINIISGQAPASISAPNGSLTITKAGPISLTAGVTFSFIESQNDLTLLLVDSITTNSNVGVAYIQTNGGGNILINDSNAKGSGGIILNATPASNNLPSYIATQDGGDIECNFLGTSSFNGGAFSGAFSGIITGVAIGSGNITFENGPLTLNGGTAQDSFATIKANGTGSISFPTVGNIDLTAGNGASGSYASIETASSGSIFINVFGAAGHLNMTAKSPINSYAVVRAGSGGQIAGNFNGLSQFQAGSGAGSIAGVYAASGNITLGFHDLTMIGGSGGGSRSAIEVIGSGNINFFSDGSVLLQGGNSVDCDSQIQVGATGSIQTSGSNIITLQGGSASGCQSRIRTFGGDIEIGNSLSKNTQLNLLGGSSLACSALVVTELNGGNINISSLRVRLQAGSGSSGVAAIVTEFGGAINISCDGLLSLQGGTANNAFAEITTSDAGDPINITAGEVFLNSSLNDASALVAIVPEDPTSFVTVITNGTSNADGDITLVANAAPAFIENAIHIKSSHDLILESVNNDAYISTTSSSPFFTPLIEVGNELIMNGSPNTINEAKITPIGAASGINITVQDDAFLTANIGNSFISGYNNINMFTGDSLSLTSGSAGSAFIESTASANFLVGSIDIDASAADAGITAPGTLNINVFDNNMVLTSAGSGDAFILGGNTSIDAKSNLIMSTSSSGSAFIQSSTYSLFNVGLDISLSGDASILKTGSGSFIMTAGRSVVLNNGSFFQNDAGPFTVLAGENIIVNGSRIENITSDDLTLVADNNFPISPEIGHGHFEIGPGSTIKTASGGKLRLFSAAQEFNTIESPLNGVAFTPGTALTDSNHERWGVYYPDSFFGGPGFTIFYKNPGDISNHLLSTVDFAASELFFRLNNMIDDLYILDYLEKFIYRSKYFFVDDKRNEPTKRERSLIKLIRD